MAEKRSYTYGKPATLDDPVGSTVRNVLGLFNSGNFNPRALGNAYGSPKMAGVDANMSQPAPVRLPAQPGQPAPMSGFDTSKIWSNVPGLDGAPVEIVDPFMQALAGQEKKTRPTGGMPSFQDRNYDVDHTRGNPYAAVKALADPANANNANPVKINTNQYEGNKNVHAGIGFAGAVSKLLAGLSGNDTIIKGVDAMADYGQSAIMRRFNDSAAEGRITASPVGLTTENQKAVRQLVADATARKDKFDEARRSENFTALLNDANDQSKWDLQGKQMDMQAMLAQNSDQLSQEKIASDAANQLNYNNTLRRGQNLDLVKGVLGKGAGVLTPNEIKTGLEQISMDAMRMFPEDDQKREAYIQEHSSGFYRQLDALGAGQVDKTPNMDMIMQILGGM